MKSDSTKKAKRSTSNVFAMFNQNQIVEFKEAFQFIDSNKDGFIDKNDLRSTFESLGRLLNEEELNSMLNEAAGPINFTMFLNIFGEKIMGTDKEEIIRKAFDAFDLNETGKIDEKNLRRALLTRGDKLNKSEIDEILKYAFIDNNGNIDIKDFVKTISGTNDDE